MKTLLVSFLFFSLTSVFALPERSSGPIQFLEEGANGELFCEAPKHFDDCYWYGPENPDERLCSTTSTSSGRVDDCKGFEKIHEDKKCTLRFLNGPSSKDNGTYKCELSFNNDEPIEGTYSRVNTRSDTS